MSDGYSISIFPMSLSKGLGYTVVGSDGTHFGTLEKVDVIEFCFFPDPKIQCYSFSLMQLITQQLINLNYQQSLV